MMMTPIPGEIMCEVNSVSGCEREKENTVVAKELRDKDGKKLDLDTAQGSAG
jgi:hypothetical protein